MRAPVMPTDMSPPHPGGLQSRPTVFPNPEVDLTRKTAVGNGEQGVIESLGVDQLLGPAD